MTSQIIKNWVYSLLFAGVLLVGSSFWRNGGFSCNSDSGRGNAV